MYNHRFASVMHESYKTILVPVDFTINTEVAICKALEISEPQEVTIHLLFVSKPSISDVSFGKTSKKEKEIDAEIKLKDWKQSVEEYLTGTRVYYWIHPASSIQQGIIEKAIELTPDLIVIGTRANHSVLPVLNTVVPSTIARATGIHVLTVKPGSLHNKIKNIVVPVNDETSEAKMNAIMALCKRNRVKVFLVTFLNNENVPEHFSASSLLRIYQWLKTSAHCPVEYSVLHGRNKAKAILKFAEEKEADILLLNPESETKIGWPDRHISDILPPASRVQILTI